MKQPTSNLHRDPTVVHFITAANEYCRLFELKTRLSKRTFVERVLKSTLTLYRAGFDLPNVRPESGFSSLGKWYEENKHLPLQERLEQDPQVQAHAKLYFSIRDKIISSLGKEYYYRKVFEPFEPNAQAMDMSLSGDLADIYCDVKEGLMRTGKRSDVVPPSVVWEWKFQMEIHWGRHAAWAVASLHSLLFGEHKVR